MKRVKAYVILFSFIVILGTPLFTIQWKSGNISEAENRYLASFPSFFEDGGLNPKLPAEFKSWFVDHIGMRSKLVELYAGIKLNFFHQSPSDRVHIGKDGWYFYTGDNNLQIATGEYPISSEDLENILQYCLAAQEKLKERGIDFVMILPTSKISIYPEYARYGDGTIRQTPADIVADYLEKNSDIKIIRLKEALLNAKQTQQVYYKTDTHWNQLGAYTAYCEIIKKMKEWSLCFTNPISVETVEDFYIGEFGAMMGSNKLLSADIAYNTVIANPNAILNAGSERETELRNLIAENKIYNPCYHYENTAVDGKKILMFGDSMFGGWNATQLLAENFPEFTYIWNGGLESSFIDFLKPDVVIYELTERYLNTLTWCFSEYVKTPLENLQSSVVSYHVKNENIEVTMKNTSGSSWKELDQIRCGLLIGGQDSGRRAYIPHGKVVYPGEEVTFIFENVEDCFKLPLEVTMLQEGIYYFGERKPIYAAWDAQIISDTTPPEVNHTDRYTINITVKNTGTEAWSEKAQTRLCIYQDGVDHGYRLYLPKGIKVKPGEEYTFTLDGFVLLETDETYLEYQMLKETVMYFGERKRVDIHALQ